MNFWEILGETAFVLTILFFLFFSVSNLLERETRALSRSLAAAGILVTVNVFFFFLNVPLRFWVFGCVGGVFVGLVLVLVFSPRPRASTQIQGNQEKIDERDVLFARFDLDRGSNHYTEYYRWRPEKKEKDDEIRKLPDILSYEQLKKNPVHFTLASAEFEFLEKQLTFVDGEVSPLTVENSPEDNTKTLKEIIAYLGSDLCGVCELDQAYVYSHVGRGPEPYGQRIEQNHRFAVVFAVEMDVAMISAAPQPPVIVETAKQYVKAARISIVTAQYIRQLGFSARAHIAGSNYQAILPPLGWKAGLGELGRLGVLITWKYGPRVRLGLVTTDFPLISDFPRVWGIQDFCERCTKCADNCPSRAIPKSGKTEENGVLKWILNREECYHYWRKVGTDCAVCLFVCPYSKPVNAFHSVIRLAASSSRLAQSLSVWGDDFFYGRFPQKKTPRF
jgi:ferredoxin